MNEKVGECPVCGINVYDRAGLNRPFALDKYHTGMGYPAEKAMPCGIDRTHSTLSEDKVKARCPFETAEEQEQIVINVKKLGAIGKGSNYD